MIGFGFHARADKKGREMELPGRLSSVPRPWAAPA